MAGAPPDENKARGGGRPSAGRGRPPAPARSTAGGWVGGWDRPSPAHTPSKKREGGGGGEGGGRARAAWNVREKRGSGRGRARRSGGGGAGGVRRQASRVCSARSQGSGLGGRGGGRRLLARRGRPPLARGRRPHRPRGGFQQPPPAVTGWRVRHPPLTGGSQEGGCPAPSIHRGWGADGSRDFYSWVVSRPDRAVVRPATCGVYRKSVLSSRTGATHRVTTWSWNAQARDRRLPSQISRPRAWPRTHPAFPRLAPTLAGVPRPAHGSW